MLRVIRRAAMHDEPRELGLEQMLASSDARHAASPRELALARTQTPLPPALEKTLTPLPLDLDKTRTPPPDFDPGDEHPASPLLAPTMLSNGDGASRREGSPPVSDEDRRDKDLVKSKLFRTKARPVKIGRFTVLERLGEGGMGVVYTAYDDQLDRKVAVKVLRGEATRHDEMGRTRLLREAQAMARLSHPNIVTVHEVGSLEHEVFIAMEFVRGTSLDSWLRGTRRPWRAVLGAFIKAGRGLEAAHRAGIVHRDFKPHNVLVGDDGAIKVLDFGLARATDHAGSEELSSTPESGAYNQEGGSLLDLPLTCTGAIMGTPAYMAPEQHEGRPATAQSDQFSFCVSLFEGLYALHPFDCSTLATLIHGVTTGRVQDPGPAQKVPGWLRRVLMRGLSVDAARRYPSMTALLVDLGKDPAAARRRWFGTAAVAGFVGAGSFGAASLLPAAAPVCQDIETELAGVWDADRGEAVRKAMLATGVAYAADTWARVQPRLDAYAQEWLAMRGEACETHHAARQSDLLFDLRSACLDQRRDSLGALVEIFAVADAAAVEKAVTAVAALPPVAGCADTTALTQAVPPPDDPALARKVSAARTILARAKAHEDAGQYAQGLVVAAPVLADAETTAYKPLLAEALLQRGSLHLFAGEAVPAHRDLEHATRVAVAADHESVAAIAASRDLFVRAELLRQHAEALADAPLTAALVERTGERTRIRAEFLNNLGIAHFAAGATAEAKATLTDALALKRELHGEDDPDLANTLNNLASVYQQDHEFEVAVDRFGEAIGVLERSLGPQHPILASVEYNLGYALRSQGKPARGEPHLQRGLAILTANAGADAAGSQFYLLELGAAALAQRDREGAARHLDRAERAIHAAGDPGMFVAMLHEARGELAQANGDLMAARAAYQTALALRTQIYGPVHFDTARCENNYGAMLLRAGEADEALTQLRLALTNRERSLPPGSPAIAETVELIGRAELLKKDLPAARASLERALQIRQAGLPPTSLDVGRSLRWLGEVRLAAGEATEAAELLRRAVAILTTGAAEPPELAATTFALARSLDAGARLTDESSSLARQAGAALRAHGAAYRRDADEIDAWLAREL
jgi:eukaryotic-like serine/threonine-protein kinase